MTARPDPVAQTRRCRLAFERALRDGVTVADASRAEARERWLAADRRLAERRCGTAVAREEQERPLQWWQR